MLVTIRNFAVAHFLSGFFLFLAGWGYGLPKGVVFGIPAVVYLSALFFSRPALTGFNFNSFSQSLSEISRTAITIILSFLILNILFCLLPPAENLEIDALNYHFVIPWQYYLRGGVVPLDWSIPDKYPLYLQMAQLPFTVIGFPWVVKIGNMIALPLLLITGWNLCQCMGLSRSNTGWTIALLSSLALFIKQYGTAMFDLSNAAYCLLGFVYLLHATLSRKKSDLLWGSLLLGMACATKTFLIYYAMIWLVAYCVWKLFFQRQPLVKFDFALGLLPGLMGLLFLSPVWCRDFFLTGNPFYPLFLQWFGPIIENKGFHKLVMQNIKAGYGRSPLDFILGPFRLVLPTPHKFDYWTDPILLAFLAGAFIEVRRKWREVPSLVGLTAFLLYSAFFCLSQEARYLYPFWILVVALGAPSIFRYSRPKWRGIVLAVQVIIGIATFFLFHRQALTWLSQGPLDKYLSRASYSFVWNREVENKNIKQLCIPNVGTATRDVYDILYFTVPVKLVQHFNSTMSINHPMASDGCDAFLVGTQKQLNRSPESDKKARLVSREIYLIDPLERTEVDR